jgi:hypothetical protein
MLSCAGMVGTAQTRLCPPYEIHFSSNKRGFAISRRDSPEVCYRISLALQNREGAGKVGCALHPRSRVQWCRGRRHTSIQVQRRHPTFPAQWFKAYTCSPRRSGFACHRRQRNCFRRLDANPEAVRPTRFRPYALASSVSRAATSTAAHPYVRDVRETPLRVERDGHRYEVICLFGKAEYFFARGLTRVRVIRTDLRVGSFLLNLLNKWFIAHGLFDEELLCRTPMDAPVSSRRVDPASQS